MRLFKVEWVIIPTFALVLSATYLGWLPLTLWLGFFMLLLMMGSTLRFVAYTKLGTQAPLKKRLKLVSLSVSLVYAVLLYVAFVLLYQILLTLVVA